MNKILSNLQLSSVVRSRTNPIVQFFSRLIVALRHEGKVDLTFDELRRTPTYSEGVSRIRDELSERPRHTHSRPIYPCDEARLRSCLTLDSSIKQNMTHIITPYCLHFDDFRWFFMDPGTYLRQNYGEYQAGNAFILLSEYRGATV